MGRLQGKVAVVTGAGRGIGRAIAGRFIAEGARVVVAARSADELRRAAQELGESALAVPADVADPAAVDGLVRQTVERFGGLDIVVNNAALVGAAKPVAETSPEAWDQLLAVNLRGPFLVARAAIPELLKRAPGGRIVNIAASSAKAATPFLGPDAAAKAGLLGLTRVLAAELGPRGITVNAVLPSIVPETHLAQVFLDRMGAAFGISGEQSLSAFTQRAPLRRAVTADEVANAVLFLASGEGSAITGQSINVDAGTIVL